MQLGRIFANYLATQKNYYSIYQIFDRGTNGSPLRGQSGRQRSWLPDPYDPLPYYVKNNNNNKIVKKP
jgi:hypothetical protein